MRRTHFDVLSCSDYVVTSSLILCENNVSKIGMPFHSPVRMVRSGRGHVKRYYLLAIVRRMRGYVMECAGSFVSEWNISGSLWIESVGLRFA